MTSGFLNPTGSTRVMSTSGVPGAGKIAKAYDEPDEDTSVQLWQDIFGEDFPAPEPKQTSVRFGPRLVVPASARPGPL
jgi:hypothetical protein